MVAKRAEPLFSFIAGQVGIFLEENHRHMLESGTTLNLGFCFSFPFYQTSVNSGVLVRWTKGFNINDAVGKDVGQLLQTELDKLKMPVRVSAIANDALGTVMTRAYTLPISKTRTSVGAIFGTGTNAVYLERLSAITKDIGVHDTYTGEMFLSIEWGSLDNKLAVLSNTEYDIVVNEASFNKDNQMFEKRVSGMFLGELLRSAVEGMYDDPNIKLFPDYRRGDTSLILRTPWSVDASILSVAEFDESDDLRSLKRKIESTFGFPAWAITLNDGKAVQKIARAIGRRAARLAGTAIGAVILQSGRLHHVDPLTLSAASTEVRYAQGVPERSEGIDEAHIVDVGVDGSVIELYPRFEQYMRESLRAIDGIGPDGERRIRIGLAKDGSSVGTAIIALIAAQQRDIPKE
jgi:hexokinase